LEGQALVLLEAPLGGTNRELAGLQDKDEAEQRAWSPAMANALPFPTLLCTQEGDIEDLNHEARALITGKQHARHLRDWFVRAEHAQELLTQIKWGGSANLLTTLSDLAGSRKVQVIVNRLDAKGSSEQKLVATFHWLTGSAAVDRPSDDEARQKWRQAAEIAAPLAFELNRDGRIVFFTRSTSSLFNIAASRLGGARLNDLSARWDQVSQDAMAKGRTWTNGVLSLDQVDGGAQMFETNGEPIVDASGQLAGFRIVGRRSSRMPDRAISEEEAPPSPDTEPAEGNLVRLDDWRPPDSPSILTEDEFASLVERLDAALIGLDHEGRIRFANYEATAMLSPGLDPLEGRKITSFFEAGFGALLGAYFASPANPSIARTFHEGVTATLSGRDGKQELISIRLHPLRELSSIRYCAFLQKAAGERDEDKESLRRLARDAKAGKKERDFLALVSHEIRTPLNAILGFSDLILQENFGPIGNKRYTDYIHDIHDSGQLILSMVEDLLDRSKSDSKQSGLSLKPTKLPEIIEKAQRLVAPQAAARNIRVTCEIEKAVPAILADKRSVLQIILNVLTNSVKYTRNGGDVVLWAGPLSNGRVRIHIQDNGIGMSEKDLELALKPYGRAQEVKQAGTQGTGLGLPLAKALATANRAEFKIESAPHCGTMVCVDFHAARAVAE
jgi:signal transduction histidine kinase